MPDDPRHTNEGPAATRYHVEINPRVPARLSRLHELANDLYYSWDRHSRGLFRYLDSDLWDDCRHNPRVFLRRVSQRRLDEAAADRTYLEAYNRALANYDTYLGERSRVGLAARVDPGTDLVVYFCAEFGLHESLPIYSGGLGILAGDFCKAASDMGLPFVAVGLLYRQGNVIQTVDRGGRQITNFAAFDIDDLPVTPVREPDGTDMLIPIELAGGTISVRVWRAKAGHIDLYLLDTDVPGNPPEARGIAHQLYTADKPTRLRQEIVLGIGGARALRRLGLNPTVWHMNEGHPSLMVVERCREYVSQGVAFPAALEIVASSTVFTTHTPVPAGHEIFDVGLFRHEVVPFLAPLGVEPGDFIALGQNGDPQAFNMTAFALRCSRYHNGVSRIHGETAALMERYAWPEVPVDDNPMGHVTNGVHVPTFFAGEWVNVLDDPAWRDQFLNADYWRNAIDALSDNMFWGVHLEMKKSVIEDVCSHIERRCRRFGFSQAQIDLETEWLRTGEDVLILGFARRFATYKRATLLLDDIERLRRLLGNPDRRVCIVFAGRAHPSDEPGKELIRQIHEVARQPEFLGKVILVEGYDLALARRLVSGVDVWVNVPEYPLEASGTSGMKAGINGVLNLSVLDGWWAEGYNGGNGWAVQPHVSEQDPARRRWLEQRELLDILEHEVIPMYFARSHGYPPRWVAMAKEAMKSIIPRFSAHRMLSDYIGSFYLPALGVSRQLRDGDSGRAGQLAHWKQAVRAAWPQLSARRLDAPPARISAGDPLTIRVGVQLNGLAPGDVAVQCLLGRTADDGEFRILDTGNLRHCGEQDGLAAYELALDPALSGLVAYRLRVFPQHPLLCHPFELGLMKWL
ncbi:MAG: alpha-glucan family phosphorylase [Gammaproteobacteria bacterium]